jgi:hypothetical protein
LSFFVIFADKVGGKYLQQTLGAFAHKIVFTEHKQSLEVDPRYKQSCYHLILFSKLESPDEHERNREKLLDRVKQILEVFYNQNNIDKMPVEIRYIIFDSNVKE